MKNILVPTDFSECSMNALEFAAYLAKKTGATMHLIHVLEIPTADSEFSTTGEMGKIERQTSSDVPFMMAVLKATRKKMVKLLKSPFLKNVKVIDNIEIGSVAEHISIASKKHHADMIVMGSHGTNGFNNLFIGSNAEKVARKAEIPLLTVKHRIENPNISKIAFASDFSDEAIKVFPFIKKFASHFTADIQLVKVITPADFRTQRETRESINYFYNEHNEKDYAVTLYNDTKKEAGIIHFADDVNADIIAIGTHGKSGLSHFFNGSISEDLINHAFLPVLTVNFKKPAAITESDTYRMKTEKEKVEKKKPYRIAATF